jgi:3-oxoacyl-[acyl-carrier-protein] synthase II
VTGLGAVTACGSSLEETWRRVVAGATGIGPIESFDASSYAIDLAGEARDFHPATQLREPGVARWARCQQLSVAAAHDALDDAGLRDGSFDPERAAIVIGTWLGGISTAEEYERSRVAGGRREPRLLYDVLPHACLERLTSKVGFRGPRMVFGTACTASTVAIAYACELLLANRADVVLTGGVDPLAELAHAGFASMGNVASQPCSPFSEPVGLSVGEGAAMLVLEREESAERRGATVRARVLGYGLTADAHHPTSGDPTGRPQARAARAALAMAGLAPSDLDYVNAHGTGTAGNDPIETRALRIVLGDDARTVPVSSLKGAVGHTLGAAGAIEASMTALALERQVIPPTANFTTARRGCDLDYVPGSARAAELNHGLSLNFAFGGNNAALVLGRAGAPARARQAPALKARRVVVTGLGVVSPIGCGVAELRAALRADRCAIAPIERFDTDGLGSRLGAVIDGFAPSRLTRADLRRADRSASLTVCGAQLALGDADLRVTADNSDALGIVAGSTHGPMQSSRRFFEPVASDNGRTNPSIFPGTVGNAGTGLAAAHLRMKGPNVVLCAGQASGLAAICAAFDLVRRGVAEALVAGGVDELEPCVSEGYALTRRIAPHEVAGATEACAPFDRSRSGLVLGEGATFLVLESLDSARGRGARIYAEMLGWGGNADRPQVRGADPSGEGMATCMELALEDGGLVPGAVDLVGAAAMSHPLHDRIEAVAIRRVFGDRRIPVAALSSRVGVSSATAPLAAAAVSLGMHEGFVPSGTRRPDPDPACDLDTVEGAARDGPLATALINATALGASNYSVALRRWDA